MSEAPIGVVENASTGRPDAALSVSVVIPTYNRAHLVRRAVESALAAILPGDEIIVVDDGSTDHTEAVLAPVREFVQYVRIPNGGAGKARNVGIEKSSKPLIAFLDSDDVWLPFKLQLQRAALAEHPELVFCCTNFTVRTPEGDYPSYLERWWTSGVNSRTVFGKGVSFAVDGLSACTLHKADLYDTLLLDGVICLITLLYRRDRAPDLRFPEDLPTYEDWEFTARLARQGLGAYLDCDAAINHGHKGQRLTDADPLTRAEARLKLMPRVWGNDPAFLAAHRDEYAVAFSDLNLRAAEWLIRHGRNREARSFLAKAPKAPLATRLWAALPVPKLAVDVVRGAVSLFRQ